MGTNYYISPDAVDDYIPTIWAQRGIDVLANTNVMARLIRKDIDFTQAFTVGKSLNINYPGTMTVSTKSYATEINTSLPTATSQITLTLDTQPYVSFTVEDIEQTYSNTDMIDLYMKPSVIALGEKIDDTIHALYSSFTTNAVGDGTAVLDEDMIRLASQYLTDDKVPLSPRYLVITPASLYNLLGDPALQSYFAYAGKPLIEGSVGRLHGFDIFVSQNVTNSTYRYNLAFHPDALVMGFRQFKPIPAGMGVTVGQAVDPQSGFALRVTMGYDQAYGGVRTTVDCLYGVALLRETFLSTIITAS